MSLAILFIVPFFASVAAVFLIRLVRFFHAASHLPGPPASFLIGNAPQLWCSPDKMVETASALMDQYGSVLRLWIGPLLTVFISDSTNVQTVLCQHRLTQRPLVFRVLRRVFRKGVATSEGATWSSKRAFTARLLAGKYLYEFDTAFRRQAVKLTSRILQSGVDDAVIELHQFCSRCALDAVCDALFGQALKDDKAQLCLKHMQFLEKVVLKCSLRPWLMIDWIFNLTSVGKKFNYCNNDLRNMISELIRPRKSTFLKELYSRPGVSDDEVLDEVVTLLVAASETSSTTLSFFFLMMALHPDVQESVVSQLRDGENSLLDAAIQEVLRLFPPQPFSIRCAETDLNLRDHVIPAGATVYVVYAKMHRDPVLFPDPERFYPKRFLGDRVANPAFRPFSAGPRACIGNRVAMMQLRTIIGEVLTHVEFLPTPGLSKMDDLRLSVMITTKLSSGYYVRIRPRCF